MHIGITWRALQTPADLLWGLIICLSNRFLGAVAGLGNPVWEPLMQRQHSAGSQGLASFPLPLQVWELSHSLLVPLCCPKPHLLSSPRLSPVKPFVWAIFVSWNLIGTGSAFTFQKCPEKCVCMLSLCIPLRRFHYSFIVVLHAQTFQCFLCVWFWGGWVQFTRWIGQSEFPVRNGHL
jgi:hypothetical protein